MANYYEEYRGKLRSPEQIVELIKDEDYISFGQFAGNPISIFQNLHKVKGRVKHFTIQCSSILGDFEFLNDEELLDVIDYDVWFFGPNERRRHEFSKSTSFMPGGLGLCASKKLSWQKPRIFCGVSGPMDAHGNFTISMSLAYEMEMLEAADIVVIEVNENCPRVLGDTVVSIKDVDYIVENSVPLATTTPADISETEDTIGAYVADLVPDGSIIQLGIGGIPDAVGKHFIDKKNLGVHTEMITDSMAYLYEKGVITNNTKKLWKNQIVGTLILGTQYLYDFVNDNPIVTMHRGSIINNPFTIAKNDGQCSINTALSVDLTGQVSSETMGHRQFSATGGQFETAYGAQFSKGGKSIIALRSTAKKGTISTIVPHFEPGTVTSLDRNNVDYIVTEYGVAALRGRTIGQRVEALINIAHPKFRDELANQAEEYKIW